jgi:hypothetical protein
LRHFQSLITRLTFSRATPANRQVANLGEICVLTVSVLATPGNAANSRRTLAIAFGD